MPSDMPRKLWSWLLLFPLLLVVFAQIKVLIFGMPLYVPEIFTLFAIGSWYLHQGRGRCFWPGLDAITGAVILLGIGFLLSALLNDMDLHGYGRLKSWFVFPVLFSCLLSFGLRHHFISRVAVLKSMFFGGIAIGFLVVIRMLEGVAFSYDHRLHGDFPSPNHLAMMLSGALIAGVSLCLVSRMSWREQKMVFSGGAFLSLLLLLTKSYTSFFALFCVSGAILFVYRGSLSRKMIWFASFLLIGGMIFVLMLSGSKWKDTMTFDGRSSLSSRMMIWQSTVRILRDHPLGGIGAGNFQREYIAYQQYFPPYLEWSVPHPHNMFLDAWVEGGVFSLIGLIMIVSWWMRAAVRCFRKNKNESTSCVPIFLFGVYFFLVGLTDVPFLRNDLVYFFVTAFVVSRSLARNPTDVFDRSSHLGD